MKNHAHPTQRQTTQRATAGPKGASLAPPGAGPIQRQTPPNSTGLPDELKSGMESLSGHSLDDVKVHYNSAKPAQLNAHAYAQGTNIHLASGQEQHLPHEAWHVVQQKQGRVQPTMQMNGAPINDNPGLEKEADVMGSKAVQTKAKAGAPLQKKGAQPEVAQRIVARHGMIWSSFLPSVYIDAKQAVITAGSADSLTGGHSFIILEYVAQDGLAHAVRIDLFVNENGHMPIIIKEKQVEVKPWDGLAGMGASLLGANELSVDGELAIPGKYSSHIIKKSAAPAVIAAAERLSGTINQDYYYSLSGYGPPGWSDLGKTPINCAWFASMLLEKAGVQGKKSVIPSVLAGKESTKEENDARFKE